jgi:hypothetical protein
MFPSGSNATLPPACRSGGTPKPARFQEKKGMRRVQQLPFATTSVSEIEKKQA